MESLSPYNPCSYWKKNNTWLNFFLNGRMLVLLKELMCKDLYKVHQTILGMLCKGMFNKEEGS